MDLLAFSWSKLMSITTARTEAIQVCLQIRGTDLRMRHQRLSYMLILGTDRSLIKIMESRRPSTEPSCDLQRSMARVWSSYGIEIGHMKLRQERIYATHRIEGLSDIQIIKVPTSAQILHILNSDALPLLLFWWLEPFMSRCPEKSQCAFAQNIFTFSYDFIWADNYELRLS